MNRDVQLQRLSNTDIWDVLIIGGGASGAYLALDSVSRGFSTLLLESHDFAKGTSSRSTKLLHGGVRYLAQGDIALVYEALHERNQFFYNAPNLCKKQVFVIPTTSIFKAFYYHFGLTIYDLLAGKLNIGKTHFIGKEKILSKLQGVKKEVANFGIGYYDGCFDDARMNLALITSAISRGTCAINYMEVENLLKDSNGRINGVKAFDKIKDSYFEIKATCVINATGVFSDKILGMDSLPSEVAPSQGVHVVVEKEFFPNDCALMIPKTIDGRILFCIPWYGKVLLGTTDTALDHVEHEPRALDSEIDFILETAGVYLSKAPKREDVLSVFAGLRPLVKFSANTATKKLSRSHKIDIYPNKLVSINGGKWTTARFMAQDTLDRAMQEGLLEQRACKTKDIALDYSTKDLAYGDRLSAYGTKANEILALEKQEGLDKKIHENYPYTYAQVYYALEHEMAQNIEDILARRIRLLFIDSKACIECATSVANFIATYKKWGKDRENKELKDFLELARLYQI